MGTEGPCVPRSHREQAKGEGREMEFVMYFHINVPVCPYLLSIYLSNYLSIKDSIYPYYLLITEMYLKNTLPKEKISPLRACTS